MALWCDQRNRIRKRLNVNRASITNLSVTATLKKMSRLSLVVVSMVTWFSISSHCALAALESGKSSPAHVACHGDPSAPNKSPVKGEPVSCCKVLRAIFVKTNNSVACDASAFVLLQYLVAPIFFTDQSQSASSPAELDTGPPYAVSFAESVLQRSVLVHAPPLSA